MLFSGAVSKSSRAFALSTGAILFALMLVAGTQPALAQRALGIDVSAYQGSYQSPPTSINWTSVKNSGITFAWARATMGNSQTDPDFVYNVQHAKAAGIYCGAYDFCYPGSDTPASEASWYWGTVSQNVLADGLTLMPMLDVEEFSGVTGATGYADWVNQWCVAITNKAALNGVYVKPVIYISACNAGELASSVSPWGAWIADYNGESASSGNPWSTSACTPVEEWGSGVWNFWQYTSSGITTPGVNGNCDEDVYNGSVSGVFNQWVAYAIASGGIFWYWDPQATASGNPYTGNMSGYWESNNWSTVSTGQSSPVGWTDGKCVIIGVNAGSTTPAFTITLNNSHTIAGIFDGGVNGTVGGKLTLNGPGIISMAAGVQGIDVPNSYDVLDISNTIAGTALLTPQGSGTFDFNGTNTYNGGTSLGLAGGSSFNGSIYFNNSSSFSSGAIAASNCFNCGLVTEGSAAITITNAVLIPVASSINFTSNPAGLTFSGPWSLNNSLILGSGGSANNLVTISGPISGSGAFLQKTNVGKLVLSGTNTYTGWTTISQGTLTIGGGGVLGNGSYAGKITNNTSLTYNSTNTQTLSGIISGTGSLIQGGGTLTLSGANTYTGATTISSGLLQFSSDGNLGTAPSSAVANSITLNGGTSGNYGLRSQNASFTLNANRGITLGANGGAIQVAGNFTLTYNGVITGSGAFQTGTSPTVGYGTLILGGANTYTGPTIIACGTLQLGANNTLPVTPLTIASADNVTGTLNMNSKSQTVGPLASSPGINGTGTSAPVIILSGALTIQETSATAFNGNITGSGGSLVLQGGQTLTLNGTNTYTGPTTIAAGTLALGSAGSINNSSILNISSGATLDVSAIPAFNLSSGTSLNIAGLAAPAIINGASGGTVNLGSQPITLTYGGSQPALTVSQGTLVLNGNAFTVNGSVLPAGNYTLIQQASGNVQASGNFTVTGTAIGAGTVGTISVSSGNVNLIVRQPAAFSNLTGSPTVTYGATSLALGGTVSGAGPAYPAQGEMISVTINGNAQSTAINDSTGDFSINFNPGTIPASSTAYAITYSYAGDSALSAATDASKTLTVNPLPAILTGTRVYDGTTTAAPTILSVTNKVGSDAVTVASGSGSLASPNVGTESIASFGNLTLGGAAAGNYTLTGASGSVVITVPPFSIWSGVDPSGSNFIITWQSAPGATYQVFGSTNPTGPQASWANVGGPITATNTITSVTNAITPPAGFFGVKGQ